ncbi:ABC transporter ATP-binding protein [Nesterenkonia sp. MY13]|uniref:ABC transporter ATP-binding protein n=2 Tax=Nesterenkonia sedimenti TaxID=1463632 RepID=A0A7X8TKZ8_9MICC|nr:ABC transporter ATP-binding protein [Nesterenkonia sedimenti]
MHQTRSASGRLELTDLVKIYEPGSDVRAVDGVSLQIEPGEFVTLLGPSGCGKTTILRTVAGFETPTSGSLTLDGKNLLRQSPSRRPVSMVFQSYALFPHMTVRENVGYGLKAAGIRTRQVNERVDEALESMSLSPYADRAPAQLSGGQQQRVALARAMVTRPEVMLFDEPLSNLDAALREHMRLEIRRLQRQLGTTALYVTHDQAEAMAMSDRVVVMNSGRIEQVGPPREIYRRPASRFVAGFVGRANFFDIQRRSADETSAEVELWGRVYTVPAHPRARETEDLTLLVRPESLKLTPESGESGPATAVVTAAVFMGDRVEYELTSGESRLLATVMDPAEDQIIPEGSQVRLDLIPERAWLLPA